MRRYNALLYLPISVLLNKNKARRKGLEKALPPWPENQAGHVDPH